MGYIQDIFIAVILFYLCDATWWRAKYLALLIHKTKACDLE